jgi:hypothetical protein
VAYQRCAPPQFRIEVVQVDDHEVGVIKLQAPARRKWWQGPSWTSNPRRPRFFATRSDRTRLSLQTWTCMVRSLGGWQGGGRAARRAAGGMHLGRPVAPPPLKDAPSQPNRDRMVAGSG